MYEKLLAVTDFKKIIFTFSNGKNTAVIETKKSGKQRVTNDVGSIILEKVGNEIINRGPAPKNEGNYLFFATPWAVFRFSSINIEFDVANGTSQMSGYACRAPNLGEGKRSEISDCKYLYMLPTTDTKNFVNEAIDGLKSEIEKIESCQVPKAP